MKIIGRFHSYSYIYGDVKVPFHVSEGVEKILKALPDIMEEPLTIDINGMSVVRGEVESFSGKKDKLTLNFLLKAGHGAPASIGMSVGVDPIYFNVSVDNDAPKPIKRVNHLFLIKVRAEVKNMGKEVGQTPDEMFKLLSYTGGFKGLHLSTQSYQVDVESFWRHMIDFAERKNIPVTQDLSIRNIKAYMRHCREDKRCVVCGKPSVVEKGLYPVCQKHKTEFLDIGRDAFESKYQLVESNGV